MNLLIELDRIKPKRISESLNAFIFKDKIVLDYGISKVLCYCKSGISSSSPICLSHKELYNRELENAITKTYSVSIPDDLIWEDISINVDDNSFFSAISGAGEDLYWAGIIEIFNNKFKSIVYGLNYKIEYNSSPDEKYISTVYKKFKIDYNSFYYMFQLTKHLTGKKIDTLCFSFKNNLLYITNSTKDYYVIVNVEYSPMNWMHNQCSEIQKIYKKSTKALTQIFKKVLNETSNPLFKTLSRPFGDTMDYDKYDNYSYYEDKKCNFFLLNNKE